MVLEKLNIHKSKNNNNKKESFTCYTEIIIFKMDERALM
jgi:hypothetical protein